MIEDSKPTPIVNLRTLICNIPSVRHTHFFERVFISYSLNPHGQDTRAKIEKTLRENALNYAVLDGGPAHTDVFIVDVSEFEKPIQRIRQVEVSIDGVRLLVVADTINNSVDPTKPFIKALAEFTKDHHPKGEYSHLSLTRIVTRATLTETKYKPGVYINADAIPF